MENHKPHEAVTLRRGLAAVVFLFGIAIAFGAALWLPYILASRSASIRLLTFSSVATFGLLMWFGGEAAFTLWGARRPRRSAIFLSGMLTPLFLAALYAAILHPSAPLPDVRPYPNTRYWQLTTGSLIAYSEYDPAPGIAENPIPIVYLHGGPGARQTSTDQAIYGSFAAQGFRVFLFDQAGSGLSGFLPHVHDYTVERCVADLEAVRQKIGAERMNLIGYSWGSTLAASYMAKYPSHVAKVVFHSPSRIWNLEGEHYNFSRTDEGRSIYPPLRFDAALMLRDRSPDASENLLPQREAEKLALPFLLKTMGSLVCVGDSNRLPPDLYSGFNPYLVEELIPDTSKRKNDPHEALRRNQTPAILLYPECNYLSWDGALDYRKTLPNLKIYYIPHAGHYIQIERPGLLKRLILAFLLDQPDPIPPYESDVDPRANRP